MNKSILMMTALLTISGMNFEAKASEAKASLVRDDYTTKWCRDAGFILRTSLDGAYNAETYAQEVSILKRAISQTLNTLNPKFSYYLGSTLYLGQKLESIVADPKDKALILRRNIENALEDLDFLDGRMSNRYDQDYSGYVRKVLNRVTDEAYRAKTDQIEKMILNAGAGSAVEILSESDNRRDPSNPCAARYLKEVNNADDVFIKRSLISEALGSLGYGCR